MIDSVHELFPDPEKNKGPIVFNLRNLLDEEDIEILLAKGADIDSETRHGNLTYVFTENDKIYFIVERSGNTKFYHLTEKVDGLEKNLGYFSIKKSLWESHSIWYPNELYNT